jgi:hypothetical protein
MLDGCMLGKLSNAGIDTNYFYGVTQPFYFIADSSADSGIVKLRLGIIDNTTGNKSGRGRITTEEGEYCFLSAFQSEKYKDVEVKVEKVYEILLGETKYYQARYVDGKLVIDELSGPNLWNGGLDEDVWGNNPVTIVEGDKVGDYWEKEKPIWGKNKNLPKGLIRLVGRYWEEGKTYKVKLTAQTQNGDQASIEVVVKKPSELKSQNQSPSYSKTRDVNDAVVNIDSLCIYFGGKKGIPPQFIKGHIFTEAAKKDFGGEVGWGFAPSYRYEPYTIQIKKGVIRDMKNNPFYITATTNVNPPNHQHVGTIPYFRGDTITVWQIVAEHSQLLTDGSTDETRLYGVRTIKDTMNYGKYKTVQNKYHSLFIETEDATKFDPILKKNRKLTFAERADSTNKRMIIYLRDEFIDEVGTKGMKNMIAQTRIASSYGYLQALYTTAINRNDNWQYPEDSNHPPEAINEFDIIFPMATRMQREYLEKGLNKQINNWILGFEASLKEYILKSWNTDDKYPNEVMINVNRFLPKK